MSDELKNLLASTCGEFGVYDTNEYYSVIANYLQLLNKWSRRISLVATEEPTALIEQHVADCLALLPHLPATTCTLIDVGSGAGLPGLLLAIARPRIEVVSVEPIGKKHSFQRAVVRELKLANCTILRERIEQHAAHKYDVAVSRATWSLPRWLEVGRQLVRPGGLVLAMEGAEQHSLPAGATRNPYPLGNRRRAIVSWQQ